MTFTKPTNPAIKLGLWTIVIETNNYNAKAIIENADDIQDLISIKNEYYGKENTDRIRIFDRDNNINMYKEF